MDISWLLDPEPDHCQCGTGSRRPNSVGLRCATLEENKRLCGLRAYLKYSYACIPQVKDKKPQRPPAASDLQDTGKAAGMYHSYTPRCEYENI